MLDSRKEEHLKLVVFLALPLITGFISYLVCRNGISNFQYLFKPSFVPSNYFFYIIWIILYLLMGVSSYKIFSSMNAYAKNCLLLYGINLFISFLWPIIFFTLEARLFAFIFILFLDIVVLIMILCFHGVNKKAAYLQIPYFIWLIFASILNFSIYIMNR